MSFTSLEDRREASADYAVCLFSTLGMIRGGENLYPREIEEFVRKLPAIHDVYVVGVPDQKMGEELLACVQLKPGVAPPTAEEFRARCKGRIAHFKIPKYIWFVDEFPMAVTGKPSNLAAARLTRRCRFWVSLYQNITGSASKMVRSSSTRRSSALIVPFALMIPVNISPPALLLFSYRPRRDAYP